MPSTSPTDPGSTFERNVASGSDFGGALYVERGEAVVDGSTFVANRAWEGGGAIYADYESSLTVGGSVFSGNIAIDGVYGSPYQELGFGGAIAADEADVLWVHDSTFGANDALNGAAIQASDTGRSEITHNTFDLNASPEGGTVAVQGGGYVVVARNYFVNNVGFDGAILLMDLGGPSQPADVVHNTIVHNISTAYGVDCDGTPLLGAAALAFRNAWVDVVDNVLAFNQGCAFDARRGEVSLAYNAFWENGRDSIDDDVGDFAVLADPLLSAVTLDGDPANDEPWPTEGSPLIDAGDPERPDEDGTRSDIGAFPWPGPDPDPDPTSPPTSEKPEVPDVAPEDRDAAESGGCSCGHAPPAPWAPRALLLFSRRPAPGPRATPST